jgi:DNA-binding transcriptional ArsR family regulator
MEARRDVFQAISDPNRRAILGLLAKRSLNLNGVADHFNISRPAISKHIKILTECGLIAVTQKGRERMCAARLGKLSEVHNWVEQYKAHWEARFDALENYLGELQRKRKLRKK